MYAEQEKENHAVTSRSCLAQWKDTTTDKTLNFFAIILYMKLVNKLKLSLNWSKSIMLNDAFVPKVMSIKRFELL